MNMAETTMNSSPAPFVSVIIPVFNDAERLKHCLNALDQQTYARDRYEVIVVDNASDDDIQGVVSLSQQAIATYEGKPGSYVARNRGIAVAKGEVIAFTDADCIPASNWIEMGVRRLLNTPNCGLVAGRITFFYRDPARPTAVELYDNIKLALDQRVFVEESHYGATANLFTFKQVIDTVGTFNETLKSSGDRDWGQRVFAAGYQQVYAEEVCIIHPARYSWGDLRKKVTRLIGGHQDLKRKRGYSDLRLAIEVFTSSIKDVLPPLRMYYYIWSYDDLKNTHQRFQFAIAMMFVRYVRAWERIRLMMGGHSSRG
jgi:glycosyltransferase involved in cell wall biosynthesis